MGLLPSLAYMRSRKALKSARRIVDAANSAEQHLRQIQDYQLAEIFRDSAGGGDLGLAFACAREAILRETGLRLYDEQLVGAHILLGGSIAQMRTGEGKTLALAPAAAVRAIMDRGVHVVTANNYLARRDADTLRPVMARLGLTTGAILEGQGRAERREAYVCDITWGAGHEFGFDYLRDNLVRDPEERVQLPAATAIIDEIDSVLLDEAGVPLIISGAGENHQQDFLLAHDIVSTLEPGTHFGAILKDRMATLTDDGHRAVERALVQHGRIQEACELYTSTNLELAKIVQAAVAAHVLLRRDRDYVVDNGEIILVDSVTGRKLPGRRLQEGLHEALEMREGLLMQPGTQTKAAITVQSYFSMYPFLCGLTGTALSDSEEFSDIHGLETVVVPTRKPLLLSYEEDRVFATHAEKFQAVCEETVQRHRTGQPVLIGCASIRDAEAISMMLRKGQIEHALLTAKNPEMEADIIGRAGEPYGITVATSIAGRGTDIILGGRQPEAGTPEYNSWEQRRELVRAAGGLCVLGAWRSPLRRVDEQLAGRAARQGDPGHVCFFVSLEDELLKVFAPPRRMRLVVRLCDRQKGGVGRMLFRKIVELAQEHHGAKGLATRKKLVEFDKVLAAQRKAVYAYRQDLFGPSLRELVQAALTETLYVANMRQGDANMTEDSCIKAGAALTDKVMGYSSEKHIRQVCLDTVDALWPHHLAAIDELRQNVSLKNGAGLNALARFHRDAFELFDLFNQRLKAAIARELLIFTVNEPIMAPEAAAPADPQARVELELLHRWVGRNQPCPCGSGQRFRQCHG